MKVILTTSIERGGPIEQALILARELRSDGVEVEAVCASRSVAERFDQAGAKPWVIPLRRIFDPLQAARIYRIGAGADVIHAHDRRAGLWLRVGPRPTPGGIRVYTAHGIPNPYLPPPVGDADVSLRDRIAYPGLDAALCKRADAVVVPSRSVADDLVRRLNFPADRMVVIPIGVDVEKFQHIDGSGTLVATLSRIDGFKALDVFLEAVAILRETRPSTRFAAFGDGPLESDIRQQARRLGLEGVFTMPGHTPAEDALRSMKIYVLCSVWENAPIALLEAMAAGVPVVATRVHGIPEIVDDSTAQLVPPGEPRALAHAISVLVDDPALAADQAHAARRRVIESFSATANAQAMKALYERLLQQRSRIG
jgi:glycosyltransferase involved in cell wall biosynthesis